MNEYKERELGEEAARFLKSDAWTTAIAAYRARLFEEIEACAGSPMPHMVRQRELLDARLSVCRGVQGHLERIMKEGAVAANNIELDERRDNLKRVTG
jgi:hypothetical protein